MSRLKEYPRVRHPLIIIKTKWNLQKLIRTVFLGVVVVALGVIIAFVTARLQF